jgi:hypothetical protein
MINFKPPIPTAQLLYENEHYYLNTGQSVRLDSLGEWCYQLTSKKTAVVEYEDYVYPRIRFLADRFEQDSVLAEEQGKEPATPVADTFDRGKLN